MALIKLLTFICCALVKERIASIPPPNAFLAIPTFDLTRHIIIFGGAASTRSTRTSCEEIQSASLPSMQGRQVGKLGVKASQDAFAMHTKNSSEGLWDGHLASPPYLSAAFFFFSSSTSSSASAEFFACTRGHSRASPEAWEGERERQTERKRESVLRGQGVQLPTT